MEGQHTMSTGRIRAGRAFIELGLDDRAYHKAMKRAGKALTLFAKIAAATAAAAAITMKVYADFEFQMAKVSTMVDDTAKHMGNFTLGIRSMAVEFGQSTSTMADGLYQLLSAGVPAAEAMDVLATVTKAAVGGFTDVNTSATAMVRVMKSYGLQAADAADVSDLLFAIVKKGVVNYEELAVNIGKVAPTAKAAGLSLEQLGAAVATVLTTEEPQRAMTALRQALFQAAAAGEDLWSFIEKFRGASLGDIIGAGIDKRAAQGVLILSTNYETLQKNLLAMGSRAGEAQKAYDKMANTLTMQFNRLKQAAILFLSKIGKVFAEHTKLTIPQFIDVIVGAADVIPNMLKRIIDTFLPVARAAGYTFGVLQSELGKSAGFFEMFATIVTDIMNVFIEVSLGAWRRVAFAIGNWRLIAEAAILAVMIAIVEFKNDMKHIFTVAVPGYLVWLRDNWERIFSDMAAITSTVLQNIAENYKRYYKAVRSYVAGGAEFELTFKPLTEDFESSLKELPNIAERELGPLEKELKDRLEGIVGDLSKDWVTEGKQFENVIKGISDDIKEAAAEAAGQREKAFAQAYGGGQAAKFEARGLFNVANAMSLQAPQIGEIRQQTNLLKTIAASSKETAKNTKGGGSTALMYY